MAVPEKYAGSGRRRHRLATVALAVLGAALVLVGVTRWHDDAAHRDGAASALTTTTAPAPALAPATARVPQEVQAPRRPGAPRGVRLPTLGVSAPVVPVRSVGRTLVPPSDPSMLGWWADGARPGARRGSALIAGHTVHGAAKGALDDLDRLRAGDPVTVTTDGRTVRYRVVRVQVFSKGRIARQAAQLFTQSGRGRLVLLTCADWDGSGFLSNVVVTARPSAAL